MAGTDAKTGMVEIVNIVPRRRWTTEEKLRMVAACEEPGKSVSQVDGLCETTRDSHFLKKQSPTRLLIPCGTS